MEKDNPFFTHKKEKMLKWIRYLMWKMNLNNILKENMDEFLQNLGVDKGIMTHYDSQSICNKRFINLIT